MIKAADMMIARRADTRARADFATWKMMAKLNGASSLPAEAQTFLASYKALLKEKPEAEGNRSHHPDHLQKLLRGNGRGRRTARRQGPFASGTDNVTAFKRPPAPRPKPASGPQAKPRLPVALIFACLVVVYVGIRYFLQ